MQETQVVSLSGEETLESGNGYPLQYSGEFHGQRSLQAAVHGVTKSRTQLSY